MKPNHLEFIAFAKETFNSVHTLAAEMREQMRTDRNLQSLADLAFALREIHDYLDECRKELDKVQQTLNQVVCVHWMIAAQTGHPDGEPIRTQFCTVTPTSKLAPVIPHPKKEPERYHALLKHFGVNDTMIWADVLRPHWPGVVDYVTNIEAAGLPAPPGIDIHLTRPIYGLTIRGKMKEV